MYKLYLNFITVYICTHTVYNTNNFMVCIVLNKEIYISINIFVHDIYTICFCKISLKKQKNKFKIVKMLLYCKSLPHQENSRHKSSVSSCITT